MEQTGMRIFMRTNGAKNRRGRGTRPGNEDRSRRLSGRGREARPAGRGAPALAAPEWLPAACRALAALLMAARFILPLSSASLPATGTATEAPTQAPTATPGPTAIPETATTPVPWAGHLMPPVENIIFMTWDYRPNTLKEVPPGVNVLAPTWFYVEKNEAGAPEVHGLDELNEGRHSSWNPTQYVATAHEGGAQVWAVVVLINDAELATSLIRSEEYTRAFIDRCNEWIEQYDLDGISFDFEYMNSADIDAFTAFVGACKQGFVQGTVVSVAVNYILAGDQSHNWWQSYDPGGLARVCDYVAVMTYSGYQKGQMNPVAPIGWLRGGIEEMLLQVPSDQLLMGVPFYGADYQSQVVDGDLFRLEPLWAESSNYRATITPAVIEKALTAGEYTTGGVTVTVDHWINRGEWDPEMGITTWSFVDTAGLMHTLWCEDENSLYQKGILASEYHLAGAAVWRMSFGRNAMWEALARGLEGR
jgi:spore germination protein YaaH